MKAIAIAVKKTSHEIVLKATQAFALAREGQDSTYTPYPATWYRQERYSDDPTTWARVGASSDDLKSIGERIATHIANPNFIRHDAFCGEAAESEYIALKKQWREMQEKGGSK